MFGCEEELVKCWKSIVPVDRVQSEPLECLPCCSRVVAVSVHWYRRRTVPCVAAVGACVACVTPSRPLIFLGYQRDRGGLPASAPRILELPVSGWALVKQEAAKWGGLLSVGFRVMRNGGRRGKVIVDGFHGCEGRELLSEFDITSALCRLWSVPAPRVGEVVSDWLTRVGTALVCDGHYKVK